MRRDIITTQQDWLHRGDPRGFQGCRDDASAQTITIRSVTLLHTHLRADRENCQHSSEVPDHPLEPPFPPVSWEWLLRRRYRHFGTRQFPSSRVSQVPRLVLTRPIMNKEPQVPFEWNPSTMGQPRGVLLGNGVITFDVYFISFYSIFIFIFSSDPV